MKDYLLVCPTKAHEEEALAYIEEFRQAGSPLNGTGGLDRTADYDEWLQKLAQDLVSFTAFFTENCLKCRKAL